MVLIRWSPETPACHREQARGVARGLAHRIPGITCLVEGPNVSPERLEDGFDYALSITFASAVARDEYLPHPAHQELTAFFADGAIESVTVYDLEHADCSNGDR
jgi:hypothetical protein